MNHIRPGIDFNEKMVNITMPPGNMNCYDPIFIAVQYLSVMLDTPPYITNLIFPSDASMTKGLSLLIMHQNRRYKTIIYDLNIIVLIWYRFYSE